MSHREFERLNVRDICLGFDVPPWLVRREYNTRWNRLWWRFRWVVRCYNRWR